MTKATSRSALADLVSVWDVRLRRYRYAVLVVGAIYFWLGGLWLSGGFSGDWVYFYLYASSISHVPKIGVYVGPLVLLLVIPFRVLSLRASWVTMSALCMALAVVAIRWLEDAAETQPIRDRPQFERTVIVGGLFVEYALSQPGVLAGHADDVLALAAIAFATRAVAHQRWVVAALSVAVAIDCKPWAGLMLPLAGACAGARTRGPLLAVSGAFLVWVPFLVVQHNGINVESLNLPVDPGSGVHYLGAAVGSVPGWPRIAQIAVALPFGALAVLRGRYYLVPFIALITRVNLDPSTVWYYEAGPVFGALLWDLFQPMRVPGLRTGLTCASLMLLSKDLGLLHIGSAGFTLPFFALSRLSVWALVIGIGILGAPRSQSTRWRLAGLRQ